MSLPCPVPQAPINCRHVNFNDEVSQVQAVESDEDEPPLVDESTFDTDEDDDGVSRRAPSSSRYIGTARGSFGNQIKTIMSLPSISLEYETDTPKPQGEQPGLWPRPEMLSPSPSQVSLRPSRPYHNFLIDDDAELTDEPWQPKEMVQSKHHEIMITMESGCSVHSAADTPSAPATEAESSQVEPSASDTDSEDSAGLGFVKVSIEQDGSRVDSPHSSSTFDDAEDTGAATSHGDDQALTTSDNEAEPKAADVQDQEPATSLDQDDAMKGNPHKSLSAPLLTKPNEEPPKRINSLHSWPKLLYETYIASGTKKKPNRATQTPKTYQWTNIISPDAAEPTSTDTQELEPLITVPFVARSITQDWTPHQRISSRVEGQRDAKINKGYSTVGHKMNYSDMLLGVDDNAYNVFTAWDAEDFSATKWKDRFYSRLALGLLGCLYVSLQRSHLSNNFQFI